MKNHKFINIKKAIFEWSQKDIEKISNIGKIEVLKNEESTLLIEILFKNCLAHIAVLEPYFAPYQFVSFEAMALGEEENIKPELIYFFHDSCNMTVEEIMDELDYGIRYCACYIPNQLKKKYLSKCGNIVLQNSSLYHVVHPDDIDKVSDESILGEFICEDVEAQYLVVNNGILSLRILQEIFS